MVYRSSPAPSPTLCSSMPDADPSTRDCTAHQGGVFCHYNYNWAERHASTE